MFAFPTEDWRLAQFWAVHAEQKNNGLQNILGCPKGLIEDSLRCWLTRVQDSGESTKYRLRDYFGLPEGIDWRLTTGRLWAVQDSAESTSSTKVIKIEKTRN